MLPVHASRSLALGLCALLAACSGTEVLQSSGACVEGQTERCACGDGTWGVSTCTRASELGACQCGLGGTGGSGPAGSGGSAGNAGAGGSSGSSGAAAVGGSSGIGGAGSGATGGSAGSGGGAGSGAGGMNPTTGGEGGMAGGTGGTAGMVATGGQSGDGSGGTGGSDGPDREPQPGELYGACLDDGSCDAGLLCVNDGGSGIMESYCTTTCSSFDPMPCPRSRGDGMPACVLGICFP